MNTRWIALCTLAACQQPMETPLEFCDGAVTARYDLESTEVESFPDDVWTIEDDSSPTGRRLATAGAPWTTELNPALADIFVDADTRSGFARMGHVVLRFDGPISGGPSIEDSLSDSGLQWLDLSTSPPTRVPYQATLSETQDQLVLKPMRPLTAGAQHAVVLTNDYTDANGDCIAPAATIQTRLSGGSDPLTDRTQQVIEATGLSPETISHLLVYTVQDDQAAPLGAAEDIRNTSYGWDSMTCDGGDCVGTFTAWDYRRDGGSITSSPQSPWELTVQIALPEGEGPHPVVIFGHGLNGSTEGLRGIADTLSSLGVAVVAMDALHHGVHPTATDGGLAALKFLGLDLSSLKFDTETLRTSFNQSNLDRLQMVELLRDNPDLDGDNIPELDTSQMLYYGVSLGGMMGPGLMATSDAFDASILCVGGGDLAVFATDNGSVADFQAVLDLLVGTPDEFDRIKPTLQAAVDAADPAVWATRVLDNRIDDAMPPSVFLPVAWFDTVVPFMTGKQLGRAFNMPQLTPSPEEVALMPQVQGPITTNHSSGATLGYFLLDRTTNGDVVAPADHGNTCQSVELLWSSLNYFSTAMDGQAIIAEPYSEYGTPPL